jgi:hypothetical protein
MQPRSLKQILKELDPVYRPQIKAVQRKQASIPGQLAAEEAGLDAKKTQAFDDILVGARRRGLGFSGIPLGEQAKYSADEYLPALGRLRQTGREQATSLEDALNQINAQRSTYAQQLRGQDLDRDQQWKMFRAQQEASERAAARAAAAQAAMVPTLNQTRQTPNLSAVDFANLAKSKLLRAGNIQPFAREAVRDQLMEQYGMSQATANKLIYKQVFPDYWETGGKKPIQVKPSPPTKGLSVQPYMTNTRIRF